MNYDNSNYGYGTASKENLVAIPSMSSYYFTEGKEYPIAKHVAWTYEIKCDLGHLRSISMESGSRSAHLVPRSLSTHLNRYGTYNSDALGTFEIRKTS